MPRKASLSPLTLNSRGCLTGIWRPTLQTPTFAQMHPTASCLLFRSYFTVYPFLYGNSGHKCVNDSEIWESLSLVLNHINLS